MVNRSLVCFLYNSQWKRPRTDLLTETRTIRNRGRTLRIQALDHDIDTAVYQCNASNPLGYVFANAFVNVLGKRLWFISPSMPFYSTCAGVHHRAATSHTRDRAPDYRHRLRR